jgi:hypothetical protein
MVSPGSVSYLAPVNPGPSVAQAGASAAKAAAAAVSRSSGPGADAGKTSESTQSERGPLTPGADPSRSARPGE